MRKNKEKSKPMKIDMLEVLINTSDKLGRHLDEVKRGCGIQESKKTYRRKKKHKKGWE